MKSFKNVGCILLALFTLTPVVKAAPFAPLKFDFGADNSSVFPGFSSVSNKTLYTPGNSFGFVGTAPRAYNRLRPNALENDFIWSKEGSNFRVDLPNGQYKAWFLYGDSRDSTRVIVPIAEKNLVEINSKQVFSDPLGGWKNFYTEKYFFRGYNYVYHNNDDFYAKYVQPNFKEATASFDVVNGLALFNFEDIPLCAMEIYAASDAPQAEKDIAYLHKELRRYTIIREVKPENLNPDPVYSAADKKQGYVTYSRFPTDPPLAGDRPLANEIGSTPSAFLAKGQKANLSLTILPLRDLKNVKVKCSDLSDKTSGLKIPASDIEVQFIALYERAKRNRPDKSPGYTYEVKPTFIKPFPSNFTLMDKGINRTILLTVAADKNTRPGVYEGTVTITPENAPVYKAPVRVRVLPVTLPDLPIVAGRYSFDYDFYYYYYWIKSFTDNSFRDYVWKRIAQNMQWNKDMGLNSIAWTEARIGDTLTDPAAAPNEQFIRWMDLYRDMGFKAMPWYGFQGITGSKITFKGDPRFSPEWTAKYRQLIAHIRDLDKERGWPEIVFYLSDELSNDGPAGATEGLSRVAATAGIRGIRTLSSVNGKPEHALIGKENILMPNAAFPITQPVLDEMKAKNTELWLYNIGDYRFTWGYYIFRTGAKGRFQWYNNTGNCYPFDDFDSDYGNTLFSAFVAGPNGPVSMVNALDMRDGLDDLKYVTLLKQLVDQAKNPQDKAVQEGKALLAKIDAQDADLRNYSSSKVAAQETGVFTGSSLWSPETCERMRWRIAECIMQLEKNK